MSSFQLTDESRVAVVGGGPAGSFFSIYFLDMAMRIGLDTQLDIYEPRDYSRPGGGGCNHCGGIISESLVQNLAIEGVSLPDEVVQRGIDSYMLHMDVGSVQIDTPLHEKRIAAITRGSGPRGIKDVIWKSFDGYLQSLVIERGANVIKDKVTEVSWIDGLPHISTKDQEAKPYDLLVVATGVNAGDLQIFPNGKSKYRPPAKTKTFICEYYMGADLISKYLGNAMHVFLLNIPRLEFAAFIPKGDIVTMCMLGDDIDRELVAAFLGSREVENCMPPDWKAKMKACQCLPMMNINPAVHPYGDRVVFVGDSGVARLYKDGIGSAYRTAKAAASTVVFHGISSEDFKKYYWPTCRKIKRDNMVGKVVFSVSGLFQKLRFTRRAMLNMVLAEQGQQGMKRHMSQILWDMFTGSATYLDIFYRTLYPSYVSRFTLNIFMALFPFFNKRKSNEES